MQKCVINDQGVYNEDAPIFLKSKDITMGTPLVLEHIKDDIVHLAEIIHKSPIDWRTKQPVMICATNQWFIKTENIKAPAINEIKKIQFYPKSADKKDENLLANKLGERPYWCISRQRAWGTPIPVFYSKNSGEILLDQKILDHICTLLDKYESTDFWWSLEVKDLIPQEILNEKGLNSDDVLKGLVCIIFEKHYATGYNMYVCIYLHL